VYQARLTSLLLSPSLLSFSLSAFGSLLILSVANWSYISPSSSLHNYIFGPYGLTTVLEKSSNALSAINGVFSSPTAYNVVVPIFALFIGLIVFVILEGMDHFTDEATGHVDEVVNINDSEVKKEMKKEVKLRAGLRAATMLAWFIYLLFFARVLVPFAILLGRIDTTHLWTGENIWRSLAAFGLLWLGFHIQVIFLRLIVLRPRVFGGDQVIAGRDR
jgi:hypothetical protein